MYYEGSKGFQGLVVVYGAGPLPIDIHLMFFADVAITVLVIVTLNP